MNSSILSLLLTTMREEVRVYSVCSAGQIHPETNWCNGKSLLWEKPCTAKLGCWHISTFTQGFR